MMLLIGASSATAAPTQKPSWQGQLQPFTSSYNQLQVVTTSYKKLQPVTTSYTRLGWVLTNAQLPIQVIDQALIVSGTTPFWPRHYL
jgi:hypothetical protein